MDDRKYSVQVYRFAQSCGLLDRDRETCCRSLRGDCMDTDVMGMRQVGDYVNRLTKVASNLVKVKVEEHMKARKGS
jgi:hypothetical protein